MQFQADVKAPLAKADSVPVWHRGGWSAASRGPGAAQAVPASTRQPTAHDGPVYVRTHTDHYRYHSKQPAHTIHTTLRQAASTAQTNGNYRSFCGDLDGQLFSLDRLLVNLLAKQEHQLCQTRQRSDQDTSLTRLRARVNESSVAQVELFTQLSDEWCLQARDSLFVHVRDSLDMTSSLPRLQASQKA